MEEPCIRIVHHSVLRLDDLVAAIYAEQHKTPGGKENETSASHVAASSQASKKPPKGFTKKSLRRWIQEVRYEACWPAGYEACWPAR